MTRAVIVVALLTPLAACATNKTYPPKTYPPLTDSAITAACTKLPGDAMSWCPGFYITLREDYQNSLCLGPNYEWLLNRGERCEQSARMKRDSARMMDAWTASPEGLALKAWGSSPEGRAYLAKGGTLLPLDLPP
jgi:hypothetical protein